MRWLMTPMLLIRLCLSRLSRLQAQESLRHINEHQLGAGLADEPMRLISLWQHEANLGRKTQPRDRIKQASVADMLALGFRIEVDGKAVTG